MELEDETERLNNCEIILNAGHCYPATPIRGLGRLGPKIEVITKIDASADEDCSDFVPTVVTKELTHNENDSAIFSMDRDIME